LIFSGGVGFVGGGAVFLCAPGVFCSVSVSRIAHCGEGEATPRAHARDTRASASFRFPPSPFTDPTFSPDRQAFWGEHQPTFLSSPQE